MAPLHWTFVFFGWFALAVFGLSLQILGRIRELCAGHEEFVYHQASTEPQGQPITEG